MKLAEFNGYFLKPYLYAVVVALLLALAGCNRSKPIVEESVSGDMQVGDAALGQEIYETGGSSGVPCLVCHTLDGMDMVGPTFQGIANVAADRVDGVSAEEYLRQSVINPGAYVVDGYSNSMNQDYGATLSDEEVDHIVAYLLTLTEE